jgi:hypothetical protein
MTETAAAAPAGKSLGQPRGVGFVIIIGLLTLGIYFLYWAYKTGEEIKRYSGEGLGGVLWLVIWMVAGIVMIFVAPSEVGKLYSRDGQEPPVTGKTGFWVFIPLAGLIIWVVKVQGALNRFWTSKGAAA